MPSDKFIKDWTRESTPALLLAIGPTLVLHYYLNLVVIDKAFLFQAAALALDSLLVGAMAVLIGTASWVSYRDAKLMQ